MAGDYAHRLLDPLIWIPASILVIALLIGFILGFRSRGEYLPLFAVLGIFVLAFVLMIAALYPLIIPPHLTSQAAASSPTSQIFMLVGFAVLIPVTLIDTPTALASLAGRFVPLVVDCNLSTLANPIPAYRTMQALHGVLVGKR
ncbi:cytochrome d ubiquinol oxidase subunit II [Pseudomonas sp. Root329]|uniref:cytochrome d ubiquinol oxidase subunit II n=1 Tax=Pseudomonas sp. Root329 TaxID=1736515 RepID=UPI0009E74CAB|nr:cytochrome d ubiquinol oxidase subunit II [Pseudomonas sp. Root329]